MNIVLLGPPGVGKGTAAKLLAKKFNIPHLSTGDVLRGEISRKSDLGMQAQEYVNSGRLVPDELVTEIVRAKLESPEAANGYILDGYPRTITQAKALKDFSEIDHVLNFSAPKKTVLERIRGRAEGRADDNPEIIMQRIAEYEEKTKPLIDFYRNEGVLSDIDSTQNVAGVEEQCIEVLDK